MTTNSASNAFNVQSAIVWAQLVEAAYTYFDRNRHNVDPNPPQADALPTGWHVLANLRVKEVLGLFKEQELIGFIVQSDTDPEHLGIVFRGTDGVMDWVEDLEFRMEPFTLIPNGGKTERGFTNVYESVLVEKPGDPSATPQTLDQFLETLHLEPYNAERVTVTGHSLGGAVAILAAVGLASKQPDLNLEIYSFAAPRVGNSEFVSTYNALVPNSFRVFNKPDLVPHVPPELLGYGQVNMSFEVDSHDDPQIKHSILAYHSILTYITMLQREAAALEQANS
ncbi:MAG TPA: lipase family protein [Bacilli bacterium]|nr:lipase family protein [Bacilli bacterium]